MLQLGALGLLVLCVAGLGLATSRLKSGPAFLAGPADDPLLTGLRGVAAFTVVLSHLLALTSDVVTQHFFASFGVVVFFMLTGHLFFTMALKEKIDLSSFYIKRVRRLVPAAVVIVAVIQFADWLEAGTPALGRAQAVAIARNFSFGFVGELYGVSGVYDLGAIVKKLGMIWSLKFEWLFYLCFPLVVAIAGKSIVRLFAITAAIGIVFVEPPMLLSGDTDSSHFFAFFIGALSAWGLWRFPTIHRRALVVILVLWAVGLVVYLRTVNPDFISSGRVSFQLVVGVFFIALLRLGREPPAILRRLFALRGVQALGTISYSLYLLHMTVIHFGVAAASRWLPADVAPFAAALPVVAVTALLSALSYYYVERPFLRRPSTPAGK